ncbi:hypothetical protein D3C80_1836580 [compost metagenome]
MAADQRGLQHRGRKAILALLEHQAQALGDLPPVEALERLLVQQHLAAARRPQPGQGVQQGGLARAVGPQHAPDLAGQQAEIQRPAAGAPGYVDQQITHIQAAHQRLRCSR